MKHLHGYSMWEIGLTLFIASSVVGGGIYGFQAVSNQRFVNVVFDDVNQIVVDLEKCYLDKDNGCRMTKVEAEQKQIRAGWDLSVPFVGDPGWHDERVKYADIFNVRRDSISQGKNFLVGVAYNRHARDNWAETETWQFDPSVRVLRRQMIFHYESRFKDVQIKGIRDLLNSQWKSKLSHLVQEFVVNRNGNSPAEIILVVNAPPESAVFDFSSQLDGPNALSLNEFVNKGFSKDFGLSDGDRNVGGLDLIQGKRVEIETLFVGGKQFSYNQVKAYKELFDLVMSGTKGCFRTFSARILARVNNQFECKARNINARNIVTHYVYFPHVHEDICQSGSCSGVLTLPLESTDKVGLEMVDLRYRVRGVIDNHKNAFHIHAFSGPCRRHHGAVHQFDRISRQKHGKLEWSYMNVHGLRPWTDAGLIIYFKKPENGYQELSVPGRRC